MYYSLAQELSTVNCNSSSPIKDASNQSVDNISARTNMGYAGFPGDWTGWRPRIVKRACECLLLDVENDAELDDPCPGKIDGLMFKCTFCLNQALRENLSEWAGRKEVKDGSDGLEIVDSERDPNEGPFNGELVACKRIKLEDLPMPPYVEGSYRHGCRAYVRCPHCYMLLSSKYTLAKHESRCQEAVGKRTCSICGEASPTFMQHLAHCREVHGQVHMIGFECRYFCKTVFRTKDGLLKHEQRCKQVRLTKGSN